MTVTGLVANPVTGEQQKPVRAGVSIFSTSRRYNDDPECQSPVGGIVIDRRERTDPATGEIVVEWEVLATPWGQPRYEWIAESDIDWQAYNGAVMVGGLRSLQQTLALDKVRHPRVDHVRALLALSLAEVHR